MAKIYIFRDTVITDEIKELSDKGEIPVARDKGTYLKRIVREINLPFEMLDNELNGFCGRDIHIDISELLEEIERFQKATIHYKKMLESVGNSLRWRQGNEPTDTH